jgi:hypothetical protein
MEMDPNFNRFLLLYLFRSFSLAAVVVAFLALLLARLLHGPLQQLGSLSFNGANVLEDDKYDCLKRNR